MRYNRLMKGSIVMKTKNITKFLIIILLSLFVLSIISSITFVYGASTQDAISAMSDMNKEIADEASDGKLTTMLNSIIGLIQIAGTGVAMIMVTVFGIKYIMASPSDKADVKKQIAPMIIGAIVLFGAVNLVDIIVNIAMDSLKEAAE